MAITISDAINKQKENKGFTHLPAGITCSTHNLVPPNRDITPDDVKKAVKKLNPDLKETVVEGQSVEPVEEKKENNA